MQQLFVIKSMNTKSMQLSVLLRSVGLVSSVFATAPAFAGGDDHKDKDKNKLSDKTCGKIEDTFQIIRGVNREGDLSNSEEQKAANLVTYFGHLCDKMEQFELG
jgi:hypothetical protein